MEKTKEYVKDLCDLEEKITEWAHEHKDCATIDEMGEVVDMIKDLAEAKKDCWKAKYYESIVEAMEEYEEEDGEGRYGYDHYRFASGRFAPKGHGHRSGFIPTPHWMPDGITPFHRTGDWADDFNPIHDYRMGYTDPSVTGQTHNMMDDRHSKAYNQYRDARRGYTETHSPEHKEKMNEHAKEHMKETVETIKDIWDTADPDLKKKMKADLGHLMDELS